MLKNKKALVFIEYDMIIRHFIHSNAFFRLEENYDVKYIFHKDRTKDKKNININLDSLGLEKFTRFHVPRKRMGNWYHLHVPNVLNKQRGTKNYSDFLELMHLLGSSKWVDRYKILSLPGVFQIFSFLYRLWMGTYKPLEGFLRKENPDIIIHPSILQGYFINDLTLICKKHDIPFVCLMNSWDNPSQKAAATGFPDKLVVWGEQTRRHAIEFMKIPEDKVLEFGAAQFQIYRQPVTEPNTELRKIFNVPSNVTLILYAGISKGVRENDHLQRIESAISDGEIPYCHVIYRPHPWRGPLHKDELSFYSFNFKHITIDPHMEKYYSTVIDGSAQGFYMADYTVTHKLLTLVDAVMSPLSTILLEAIIHQKPILVFHNSKTHRDRERKIMKLASTISHFSDLKEGPGINHCKNNDKILATMRVLLEQTNDQKIKDSLEKVSKYFTVMDGPTYAERLLDLADELTSGKNRKAFLG